MYKMMFQEGSIIVVIVLCHECWVGNLYAYIILQLTSMTPQSQTEESGRERVK